MARKPPTDATESRLWRAYSRSKRSDAARNALIEYYRPLVVMHAKKLFARLSGVELADLVQWGVFGLIESIRSFRRDRNVKFSTYSAMRIHGAMLDGMREYDWVPRLVRSQQSRIQQARQQLTDELGREPTDTEIATAFHVPHEEQVTFVRDWSPVRVGSMNAIVARHDGQPVELGGVLSAPMPAVSANEVRDFWIEICRGMSKRERLLMLLYYREQLPMHVIGESLGLSESRVSQMHTKIMSRLRQRPELLQALPG